MVRSTLIFVFALLSVLDLAAGSISFQATPYPSTKGETICQVKYDVSANAMSSGFQMHFGSQNGQNYERLKKYDATSGNYSDAGGLMINSIDGNQVDIYFHSGSKIGWESISKGLIVPKNRTVFSVDGVDSVMAKVIFEAPGFISVSCVSNL